MAVGLVANLSWSPASGEPPAQPRMSVLGRALVELAAPIRAKWGDDALVGVYQAVGPAKVAMSDELFELMARDGFDALAPWRHLMEFSPMGPALSLTIAMNCRGPFFTLEADVFSGALALAQAATDLDAGRCTHAFVAGAVHHGGAWLIALERRSPGLQVRALYGANAPEERRQRVQAAGRAAARWLSAEPHDVLGLGLGGRALEEGARAQIAAEWNSLRPGPTLLVTPEAR